MLDHDLLAYRFEPGLVIASAQGSRIRDVHGNSYIDYLLGNCCSVLGHSHPQVAAALARQVRSGINVGDFAFEQAAILSELVCRLSGKDAVRFVSSGSEAVHLAVRLARAKTGRANILKFEGHYHGWFDGVLNVFTPGLQSAQGIPEPVGPGRIFVIEWNDQEALAHCLAEHGETIACTILEPVLAHAGTIPPAPGFLEELESLCRRHGVLMVFDECITGFRIALGGAQERLGMKADLVTYSKALGAGVPIGAICGRKDIMELLQDSVYQAATFDGNCLSVAAALAVLETLERDASLTLIEERGWWLRSELSSQLSQRGVPHVVQGFGALFQIFLTAHAEIRTYRQAIATDLGLHRRLCRHLLNRGVYVYPGFFPPNQARWWLSNWFVSAAHGEAELQATVNSFKGALDSALSDIARL